MKKILIVEDHPDMRELLRAQIDLMGFSAITARNGKEGIKTATAEKPDLIMMDFMMPEMDGCEATRILRATSEIKEIPIIAVTALFRPISRVASKLDATTTSSSHSALRNFVRKSTLSFSGTTSSAVWVLHCSHT